MDIDALKRAVDLLDSAEIPDEPHHVRCTVQWLKDQGIEVGDHVKLGAVIKCDDGSTFTIVG